MGLDNFDAVTEVDYLFDPAAAVVAADLMIAVFSLKNQKTIPRPWIIQRGKSSRHHLKWTVTGSSSHLLAVEELIVK